MGLFSKGKSGGMMNVIRCDEEDYLVWKWRPAGQDANSTSRENSIRYGSSLRVKDGEMAVFVYKQKDGPMQDFIMGPFDQTIKTDNFPVLASLVGLAFGGSSPFQAEVYFINLSSAQQVKFAVPYFDVFDPRFPDMPIQMSVIGSIKFNLSNPQEFIKKNRLIDFTLDSFARKMADSVRALVQDVTVNIPVDNGIPVLQLARKRMEVKNILSQEVARMLARDYGANFVDLNLTSINFDDEDDNYLKLQRMTTAVNEAQNEANLKNIEQQQAINMHNLEESMRIQREAAERQQRLQSESQFINAHALNRQAEVMNTAAQSIGQMGNMGGGGAGGNFNPGAAMAGMMMGTAMGGQMAGMMNTAANNMMNPGAAPQAGPQTPPPPPQATVQWSVSSNGQVLGQYTQDQLTAMAQQGQFTPNMYVWKQGMAGWQLASATPELASCFGAVPPPPPM